MTGTPSFVLWYLGIFGPLEDPLLAYEYHIELGSL